MGTCTSATRHQQKQQQQYNRTPTKNSIVLDIKPPLPPPLPSAVISNRQFEYSQNFPTDLTSFPSTSTKPIFHPADTNSLIQLYSSDTNNNYRHNNNTINIINWMASSSSSSSVTQIPPRIPVSKSRLPTHLSTQSQQFSTTQSAKPTNISSNIPNNCTDSIRPMSTTNQSASQTTTQNRFGFVPRPVAPAAQHVGGSTIASRSRSISPTSIVSGNSSSSTSSLVTQRLTKAQALPSSSRSIPTGTTTNVPNFKKTSPRSRDPSVPKTNVKLSIPSASKNDRIRSKTPASVHSPSTPSTPYARTDKTTDISAIRERYKLDPSLRLFKGRNPMPAPNGSPLGPPIKSPESPSNVKEKKTVSPSSSQTNNTKITNKIPVSPPVAPSNKNIVYTSITPASNQPSFAHLSQGNKHRQRAISMLSDTSGVSNALNQDMLLEDDNCSLKSGDLMCDYDDTLTTDSFSKNDRTDSCSATSSIHEANKKDTTRISVTPTKPNPTVHQATSKVNRSASITKATTSKTDKSNGNLRESLDELTRLSCQIENSPDKCMTSSVSLKPPASYLPPLEDAEIITMDVESYRQVMKDVTVIKTILHQLDRLLKHSDGANMTDSMIGSFHEFHESLTNSRRYSISITDGNHRPTIDENSSYDDLVKEIIALRKEKEQDKQTIKLLQEQMYKYSSQTIG